MRCRHQERSPKPFTIKALVRYMCSFVYLVFANVIAHYLDTSILSRAIKKKQKEIRTSIDKVNMPNRVQNPILLILQTNVPEGPMISRIAFSYPGFAFKSVWFRVQCYSHIKTKTTESRFYSRFVEHDLVQRVAL